jgi:uncharacterized membrane protein YeaQ/YmgE (transglycosylase-associated protein family)
MVASRKGANMWDLIVFALIGLLTGAASRVWYPGREPQRIVGTMLLGIVGSLLGGLVSWGLWPAVDGLLSAAALLISFLGAVLVIVVWAVVAYARTMGVPPEGAP